MYDPFSITEKAAPLEKGAAFSFAKNGSAISQSKIQNLKSKIPTGLVFRVGFLVLLVSSGLLSAAQAQVLPLFYGTVYRPPGVQYQVFKSPHFDVIFEAGAEAEAREAAAILEAQLPRTQALIGSPRRLRMPVVINQFNDRSNGFVTAFPFRQEIEGVGIKGSRLSASYSSWMWAVAPHELVHATQAQAGRGFGVGEVVRWFAPDLTRSLNLTLPLGITEGAAVYHESRVQEGAGRLNFSLFQMQFRAAMLAKHPWSLAQMLEVPAFSRPANRFYIGGSNLFQYLADQDAGRFFRRAMAFHYRFPFLGHGIELWYGTGRSPARLGREFRAAMRRQETARIEALGPLTEARTVAQGPGRLHRRPRWLDDSTLVAHISGYDVRQGFYRFDARTGRRRLISHQNLTEDDYFSLSKDSTALLFTRYVRDPFVSIKSLAEVFRLDLTTGRATTLTTGGRAHAPVEAPQGVWALQNSGQFNQWIRIEADGSLVPLTGYRRAAFIQLAPSPVDETVAVVLNVGRRQGLFRASFEADGTPTLAPWLFFDNATIHDVAWSADGRYLLFSADPDGIANIFAYDLPNRRVVQLTNVAFGALEPNLSPDGRTLAFVAYQHERFDLVTIPFVPGEAGAVPASKVTSGEEMPWQEWVDGTPEVSYEDGEVRPYRAGKYLGPRMIYPAVRYEILDTEPGDTDLGLGLGLTMQSADPLQRWAYGVEAFYQDNRAWGRLTATTSVSILRPSLSLFDMPSTVVASVRGEDGTAITRRLGREERGARLGVSLPVILASNVFSTTAGVSLRGEYEEERFFGSDGQTLPLRGRDGEPLGSYRSRFRLTPNAFLAYRLQTNRRDLMPNTGTVLSSSASLDLWQEGGGRRRGVITQLTQYVPLSLRRHTGVRLQAGLLAQNQGSIYNLDRFLPRGYENEFLDRGTFLRLNLELQQPLWYIDNGFVILPLYFKALYAYGFAETLLPLDDRERLWSRFSSTGAGLGMQLRFFYLFDFDLRLGLTYLLEEQRWKPTYR